VNGTYSASDVAFPIVHNSPSKPAICPTTPPPGGACSVVNLKTEFKDRHVKFSLKNTGTARVYLTSLDVTWTTPAGKLKKIKLGADVLYDNPDVNPTTKTFTFKADKKSKIDKGHTEVLDLEFANKVNATNVTSVVAHFKDCPDPLKLIG